MPAPGGTALERGVPQRGQTSVSGRALSPQRGQVITEILPFARSLERALACRPPPEPHPEVIARRSTSPGRSLAAAPSRVILARVILAPRRPDQALGLRQCTTDQAQWQACAGTTSADLLPARRCARGQQPLPTAPANPLAGRPSGRSSCTMIAPTCHKNGTPGGSSTMAVGTGGRGWHNGGGRRRDRRSAAIDQSRRHIKKS
jgi:hypothetical protein